VETGEALLDAEAVVLDVQVVALAERLGRRDAGVVVLPHLIGREVRVRSGTVPVAAHGLGVQRRADAEVLADAVQEPAREPQLISDLRCVHRTDLELPLPGHDLGVDARDLETRLEAHVEVLLHHGTAEHLVRTDPAVVATLRGREPLLREAERARALEERVLLLDAEPRVEAAELLRHLDVRAAGVGRVGLAVDEHDLAEDELVVPATDRVRDDIHGLEDAVRLVARRLLGARSVEAPDRRLLAARDDLRLRAQLLRGLRAVDPDVLSAIHAHANSSTAKNSRKRATAR
jgi:hypothetical protein